MVKIGSTCFSRAPVPSVKIPLNETEYIGTYLGMAPLLAGKCIRLGRPFCVFMTPRDPARLYSFLLLDRAVELGG